jgi:antitoxin component YwqK of YwqJK toxin-antitoxin module
MRSYINFILLRFFAYFSKPQLASSFCFDLSNKNDNMHWVDGNRQFFASGKYIHGKKHGEFRRYDAEGNPIAVEKYNEGVLYSRLHVRMKKSYIRYS